MSNQVPDARDMAREGDLNTLKQVFQDPTRFSWNQSEVVELEELYNLAKLEDAENPVGWIQDFNRSHPIRLDVGGGKTRLSKILTLARVHIQGKQDSEARRSGFRGLKREF